MNEREIILQKWRKQLVGEMIVEKDNSVWMINDIISIGENHGWYAIIQNLDNIKKIKLGYLLANREILKGNYKTWLE